MKSWYPLSIVAVLILMILLVPLVSAFAEEGGESTQREAIEEWREILKFGIDTEIPIDVGKKASIAKRWFIKGNCAWCFMIAVRCIEVLSTICDIRC